jgi:lysophospholipase L1-like esterase
MERPKRLGIKEIGKNVLAIFLGLALALVALEVLLRVFQPVEYRVRGNKIILTPDKKYIFDNNKIDKLDKVIYVRRNHLGFRGEALPRDFAHTLTILTVGGSTTECIHISDGKTWPDLLASRLKRRFKPLWLNNAGIDGHSTFGHLVLMEDYIIPLKPKMVIFLLGANDRCLEDYSALDRKSFKKPAATSWKALVNTLARYSEVVNYAVNLSRYAKAHRGGLVHANIDFAKLKTIDVADDRLKAILAQHQEHYLIPYGQRLQKLIDLARRHGIEPVFITQPMIYGAVIDPVSGTDLGRVDIGGINGKTSWEILKLYNEVTKRVAAQNQVLLIDLASELPKTSRYFYDTFHFTNEGCQAVAEIISQHLAPFLAKKFPDYAIEVQRAKKPEVTGMAGGKVLKGPGARGPSPAGGHSGRGGL